MAGLINGVVFILATISLGYFVCIKASKEQKLLKVLGFVLGFIIIVTALSFLAATLKMALVKPTGMQRMPGAMNTRPMMPPAMPPKN